MRIYPTYDNSIFEMNCTNHYNQYYDDNSNNEHICAICLAQVNTDNKFLTCDHLFHPLCIIRWSKRQKMNKAITSCPCCKVTYNYNVFSDKIISYHINYTETYIQKFQLVLKSRFISYINRLHIKKLLTNYKNINSILKQEQKTYCGKCYKSKYFDCYITPISSDLVKLISIIEQQFREKERLELQEKSNSSENTDNNLLPKIYSSFCKNKFFSLFTCIYKR